jgi:single-strand DNA-binding protein
MSQGAYVTITGFVAQDPSIRTTQTGKVLTKMRVGTTPRYRDASGHWHDSETSYFDVACWGRLAHNVRSSLRKGEPVALKGRLQMRTFEDRNGNRRESAEITADTVGHDLNRGPANYLRPQMQRMSPENGRDDDRQATAAGIPGHSSGDDRNGFSMGEQNGFADPDEIMDPDDIVDEEAIERFGHEMDEADLAARAWRDHEGGTQDDEAPDGDTPGGGDGESEADASGVADDPAVGTAPAVPAASY